MRACCNAAATLYVCCLGQTGSQRCVFGDRIAGRRASGSLTTRCTLGTIVHSKVSSQKVRDRSHLDGPSASEMLAVREAPTRLLLEFDREDLSSQGLRTEPSRASRASKASVRARYGCEPTVDPGEDPEETEALERIGELVSVANQRLRRPRRGGDRMSRACADGRACSRGRRR